MATRISALFSILLLISAAVVSPWPGNSASANGATRVIVNDSKEGPYLFRVGVLPGSPKVGNLHLSVLIQPAEGDEIISDGKITVIASDRDQTMIAHGRITVGACGGP